MTRKGDSGSNLAPFLSKCYEMVDDESTDEIISWGQSDGTFVILDMTQFTQDLLPKYFKHSNFSSFMRQLNIYGFRKADVDRWEFANDAFIKGQKHLLKSIKRRKNIQGSAKKNPQPDQPIEVSAEADYNNLEKEVETLKTDKTALMQELSKVRERQESSQNKLLLLRERLQGMENNQQQLLSFLVMVMQSPGLLVELLQPKETSWRGKITWDQGTDSDTTVVPDGSIVRYQPMSGDNPPNLTSMTDPANAAEHNFSFEGVKDFFMNFDFLSSPIHESLPPPENHEPSLPELDLEKLEQFLLSSPSRDFFHEPYFNDEDTFASEMDAEPTSSITQLTNYEPRDSTLWNEGPNESSLEVLTEKMGCLSPGRMTVEKVAKR